MKKEKKEKRFVIMETESTAVAQAATILLDKITGVQYLFYQAGYGGGLTPLLDKDGKPILEEHNE